MIKRVNYQDKFNKCKVWQVTKLKGGLYLKQFINGVQFGRGQRVNKKILKEIGILDFSVC